MPVPPSVSTRTVVGTYIDGAGGTMRGTVTFRVEQSLIATVESWGVNPTPITVALANGSFSQDLMASDDIDLFPSGFRYIVQERFQNGYIRTYSIVLPAGGIDFDLPSASQYEPGNIALATVNSINGRVGIVTLGALDVSAVPLTQKGAANGVPTLDSSGKIPSGQLPAPTAGVSSVQGRTGVVTLNDLFAAFTHTHAYPVTSVNSATGAVTVTTASIGAIPLSQKAAASGVASLDSGGHLLTAQVPDQVWITVFDAVSQAAMLALAADRNDICRRTDTNQSYVLVAADPTQLSNWKLLLTPPSAVTSVNGDTGAVVLTAADVSAVATSARGAANGVASLDSGVLVPVVQIPGLPSSKIISGLLDIARVPTGTTSTTVSLGNHTHSIYILETEKAAPSGVATLDSSGRVPLVQMPIGLAAVASVNGQTGAVTLNATDVSALPLTARGAVNGVAALDGVQLVPLAQIPNLAASKITSGTLDIARIPTGIGINQVSLGNHTHTYVPVSDKGVPFGVASLEAGGQVPIGQIPTGTSGSTVALGSHNHDDLYVLLADKGVMNGIATLDGTGKVPAGQLPVLASVTSVNGQTGVVTLTATDVSALPTSQKGAASGVASLDGATLVPFAQLPVGTTSSTVSVGNHGHAMIKAINSLHSTAGTINPLPNTSSAWVEVSTNFRITVAAVVGDVVRLTLDFAYDQVGTSQMLDAAIIISNSPVRFSSTGTSTAAANGDPSLSYGGTMTRPATLDRYFTIESGDLSSGIVMFSLVHFGPGSAAHVYASAAQPLIAQVVNYGVPAA